MCGESSDGLSRRYAFAGHVHGGSGGRPSSLLGPDPPSAWSGPPPTPQESLSAKGLHIENLGRHSSPGGAPRLLGIRWPLPH